VRTLLLKWSLQTNHLHLSSSELSVWYVLRPLSLAVVLRATQTCIAVLYCIITCILLFDGMLNFLVSCGLDSALLIAVIVVAVTVGKPLSYLNCAALSSSGGTTSSFIDSVGANMEKVNYYIWVGATTTPCYEMKAIWGLSISLCILFAFSSVVSACLWKRKWDVDHPKENKDETNA
jgi:hypothetical protein